MADNINISPDMIDNLVNMLKNSSNNNNNNSSSDNYNNNNNNNNNNSSSSDNNNNNNNNNNSNNNYHNNNKNSNGSNNDNNKREINDNISSNSSNSSPFGNLDFETIMKMKSIMDSLNNSNDQDSKLLYSLKPYLRKSRQAKLDQYINILKISQISKLFKKGDDS